MHTIHNKKNTGGIMNEQAEKKSSPLIVESEHSQHMNQFGAVSDRGTLSEKESKRS
jgi:hypothetical protein